jgi:hypothetical protein
MDEDSNPRKDSSDTAPASSSTFQPYQSNARDVAYRPQWSQRGAGGGRRAHGRRLPSVSPRRQVDISLAELVSRKPCEAHALHVITKDNREIFA